MSRLFQPRLCQHRIGNVCVLNRFEAENQQQTLQGWQKVNCARYFMQLRPVTSILICPTDARNEETIDAMVHMKVFITVTKQQKFPERLIIVCSRTVQIGHLCTNKRPYYCLQLELASSVIIDARSQ